MRTWVLAGGIGALALGTLAFILPDAIGIGSPESIIILTGLVAICAAAVVANRGFKEPRVETDPPDIERPDRVPLAGEDIDELINYADPPHRFVRERRQIRKRTQALVHDVLCTFEGMTGEAASERITGGEWTDDPEAARFLATVPIDREHVFPVPLRRRLLGPRSIRHRVTRTLEAVAPHLPGWDRTVPAEDGGRRLRLGAPRAGVSVLTNAAGETGHWRGVSVVALAALGTGVIAELAPLVFGGVVGIAYVAYSRAGGAPEVDLAIERDIAPADPDPGEPVTVTLTVINHGRSLPDVRLIDGVPGALSVTEGHARASHAIPRGAARRVRYTVEAVQGTHHWEPALAIARSTNGTYERRSEIDVETTLVCRPVSQPIRERIPLRTQGAISVGQLQSDRAGEGVEFQSVREYRPGDRRTRIDWRRYARFGDLTTVEFREERATTVIVAIDAREPAYRARTPRAPHAVEISAGVADRLTVSLLDAGHRVGLTSIAPEPCWLEPKADRAHRARVRELLASDSSIDHVPPDQPVRAFAWVEWLRSRMAGDAQLLLLSPLCDEMIVETVIRVEARGHPVTIISPDPTLGETLGSHMAGMERAVRIAQLRRRGVTVIDWPTDQELDAHLMRLSGRWP